MDYNQSTGLLVVEETPFRILTTEDLDVTNNIYYRGTLLDPDLQVKVADISQNLYELDLEVTDISQNLFELDAEVTDLSANHYQLVTSFNDLSSNAFRKSGGTLTGSVNMSGYDLNSVRRIYLDNNATDYFYYKTGFFGTGLYYGSLNISYMKTEIDTNANNILLLFQTTSDLETKTTDISGRLLLTNQSLNDLSANVAYQDIALSELIYYAMVDMSENYLNKTTTTTQETNNEVICKKLRIKGNSTGTITDTNSAYFSYDGTYSYFVTNGGTGFSMSNNAFNITPTAGCYLGGYALIFGGSNTDSLIRGFNAGTATNKKSLIIQAGDAVTDQEHYIFFMLRDTSRNQYTCALFDGRNERMQMNRDIYFAGNNGVIFNSSDVPASVTNKLYREGADVYWNGSKLAYNSQLSNYLPLTGGTLTGDLSLTTKDLNSVRRIYFDGNSSRYLYYYPGTSPFGLGAGLVWSNGVLGDINIDDLASQTAINTSGLASLEGTVYNDFLQLIGGTLTGNLIMSNSAGVEFSSSTAPGTTTNLLYRSGSDLYWNGALISTGGAGTASVTTYTNGAYTSYVGLTSDGWTYVGDPSNNPTRTFYVQSSGTGNTKFSFGKKPVIEIRGFQVEDYARFENGMDISGVLNVSTVNGTDGIVTANGLSVSSANGLKIYQSNTLSSQITTYSSSGSRPGEVATIIGKASQTTTGLKVVTKAATSGTDYSGYAALNTDINTNATFAIKALGTNAVRMFNSSDNTKYADFDVDSNGYLKFKAYAFLFCNRADTDKTVVSIYAIDTDSTYFQIVPSNTLSSNTIELDVSPSTKSRLFMRYGTTPRDYILTNDGSNILSDLNNSSMTYYSRRHNGTSLINRYVLNDNHEWLDNANTPVRLFYLESSSRTAFVGSSSTYISVKHDGTNGTINCNTGLLYLAQGGTNLVSLTSSGSVMTVPRLQVYGTNSADAFYVTNFGFGAGYGAYLNSTANATYPANQNGMVWVTLRCAGAEYGNILCNGSGTTYNTSSDYRLKFDIEDMNEVEAVERMSKLRTRQFRWHRKPDRLQRGFIAHELQEDGFKLATTGFKDEVDASGNPVYQGVDYGLLVADLCCVSKALIKQVEKLQEENLALTNKVAELEAKLAKTANMADLKLDIAGLQSKLKVVTDVLIQHNLL